MADKARGQSNDILSNRKLPVKSSVYFLLCFYFQYACHNLFDRAVINLCAKGSDWECMLT